MLSLLLTLGLAAGGEAGSLAAIEAATREVSRAVEEIRGLAFKRPVAVKLVASADAREHFRKRAEKLWPEAQVRLEQRVYTQLGLLPEGTDLLPALLDVLEEQAMGYYDPGSDTFYVVEGGMSPEMAPMLLAHELTHALDDQHYDIDGLLGRVGDDDDRATAIAAVVEGSGTAVMASFLAREMRAGRIKPAALAEMQKVEQGRAARFQAAAPVLQRSLLASYVLGLSFLLRGDPRRIATGLDPGDFNHAFQQPPVSSEQILHPEKYWDPARRDLPRAIALPDLSPKLGGGWSLVGRGSLGELVLAVLAGDSSLDLSSPEMLQPGRWTNTAASGTAGDVFHHYASGDRGVTVLATTWDSERDAEEFQASLRPAPRRRSFRYGRGVLLLAGDDLGSQAEAVAAAALSAIAAAAP